jgi:hypothetical protein
MRAARLSFAPFILAMALITGATSAQARFVALINLSQPFGARQSWQFIASQGPDIPPPDDTEDVEPGVIRLCISADGGLTCRPDLQHLLSLSTGDDIFSEPHFLYDAGIVHPRDGAALLLLRVASVHSTDGNQRLATVALAYDKARESFVPVYEKQTGRNNSQEVRYVYDGPLKGSIISAEPTEDGPYGFWVTINAFRPEHKYEQVLRYRSSTRYGDGNPLAVIDSEMPSIEQRLGLWKPGSKLPLPKGKCLNPRLVHKELWC